MAGTFAAFIMTYERPAEVRTMITNLLGQTFPPEKILVVDNSGSFDTRDMVQRLDNPRVEYLRVGHNAGPAGAAHYGIKHLSEAGYQWVYWGDDNDPPRSVDAFERVLSLRETQSNVGALGAFGTLFSHGTAKMKKIPNEALNPVMEVDSISGGNTFIINTAVVPKAGLPDPGLFFGFEEFDYCRRITKAGFRLVVNGTLFKEYRLTSGKRLDKSGDVFTNKVLWREYYSVRNLIYIFTHKHFNPWIVGIIVFRTMLKQLLSLKQGFSFFSTYLKLTSRAMVDGIRKNMGLTLQPGKTVF